MNAPSTISLAAAKLVRHSMAPPTIGLSPCVRLGLATRPFSPTAATPRRLPTTATTQAPASRFYSSSSSSTSPPPPQSPTGTWRAASKAQTAHGVVRKPGVLRKLAQHTYKVVRTGGQVGVVLVSIATGGLLLWAIGDDLLSSGSPNNVYASTVKRLRNVTAVTSVLGDDFKGMVEIDEDKHHWRSRQVTHSYVTDRWGRNKMVLQFYLKSKSTGAMAKVTCEMGKPKGEEEGRKWVYEKLVCECFLADGSQKTVRVV